MTRGIKKDLPKSGRKVLLDYLQKLLLVVLAAEFPLLVYWTANLGQVRTTVAIKPLFFILAAVWLLFSLFALVLRNLSKAALLALLFIFLFFTYGHLINLLESTSLAAWVNLNIVLLLVYAIVFLLGVYFIFRARKIKSNLFAFLLFIFTVLTVFNAARILLFDPRLSASSEHSTLDVKTSPNIGNKPDVYVIILDSYARNDVLQEEFGFDNSAFLAELEVRGFYIPRCALSNYDKTPVSIPSMLNLDYLDKFGIPNADLDGLSPTQIDLILNNQARGIFADMGYKFVSARGYGAFDDIQDAEIYLNYYLSQGKPDELADRNFLYLFSKTTLLRAFFELASNSNNPSMAGQNTGSIAVDTSGLGFEEANFWFHQTNYVFESLQDLPKADGNYFVYAHINAPHVPYVFHADGSFRFITDYSSDEELYTDTITYLNSRVLQLVDTLIADSDEPPVIIVLANHSAQFFERGIENHKIFSAYYLPGEISIQPYETITPVNSLRLVLHNYFDPSVELLPDLLFIKTESGYQELEASCDL